MLVLLSPAKTLNLDRPDATLDEALSSPVLIQEATAIVQILKGWSLAQTQARLQLSDALAAKVHAWHQAWTPEGDAVAGWTFRGDAFKSMDLPSLPHAPSLRPNIACAFFMACTDCSAPGSIHARALEKRAVVSRHSLQEHGLLEKAPSASGDRMRGCLEEGSLFEFGQCGVWRRCLAWHPVERVVTCALERRNGTLKAISSFAKPPVAPWRDTSFFTTSKPH